MTRILAILPNTLGLSCVTLLDEIQCELDEGNEVTIIGCQTGIRHCEYNLTGHRLICYSCSHAMRHSIKQLKGDFKTIKISDFITDNKNELINDANLDFDDVNTLKNIKYKNYDVGYAVMSTYVSSTLNFDARVNIKFNQFIKQLFHDSITLYNAYEKAIKSVKPDKILIYNGRLHTTRPALRLAKIYNIQIDVLEVIGENNGPNIEKVIFKNSLPHSIDYNTDLINMNWDSGDPVEREVKANDFFIKRKTGASAGDKSYTQYQELGKLPENINYNKKNIAIFNTSDFEKASIGPEWEWNIFRCSQNEAIEKIVNALSKYDHIHIYLRLHPNLSKIKYKYHTDYFKLSKRYQNLTIIYANSKISTYSLLEACDIVITFGSTVGVEATYWGKPSILLGNSKYVNIDATYNPSSEREFLDLILNDNLKSKDNQNALKYGYFLYGSKGKPYKHFDLNKLYKFPFCLNSNLYLYHLSQQRKISFTVILNFILFVLSRFLKNTLMRKKIPKEEK